MALDHTLLSPGGSRREEYADVVANLTPLGEQGSSGVDERDREGPPRRSTSSAPASRVDEDVDGELDDVVSGGAKPSTAHKAQRPVHSQSARGNPSGPTLISQRQLPLPASIFRRFRNYLA